MAIEQKLEHRHLCYTVPAVPRLPICFLAALALLASTVDGRSQTARGPIQTLTDADIQTAITLGQSGSKIEPYPIRIGKAMERMNPIIGAYTTPFRRVALAAFDAKRRYRPFTALEVTEEMTRPTFDVVVMAQQVVGFWRREPTLAQVLEIVITEKGGRGTIVRPISRGSVPATYRNFEGFAMEAPGLLVSFPVDALKETNELHVVFDQKALGICTDCTINFKLSTVR